MIIASDFHPTGPGSIRDSGNFFKKTEIFLITIDFQKFWQKKLESTAAVLLLYAKGRESDCSDRPQVTLLKSKQGEICTKFSSSFLTRFLHAQMWQNKQ